MDSRSCSTKSARWLVSRDNPIHPRNSFICPPKLIFVAGILILAIRSGTPASLISKTFGPEKLNIPKAPALGLLLERPIFETYNKRISTIDEGREPVKFDDYEVNMGSFFCASLCQCRDPGKFKTQSSSRISIGRNQCIQKQIHLL